MSMNDPPNKFRKPTNPPGGELAWQRVWAKARTAQIAKTLPSKPTAVDRALNNLKVIQEVIRMCRLLSKNPEDLAQDTFERMLRNKAQYEGQSPVEGWAYRIAKNCNLDHIRHEKVRSEKQHLLNRQEQSDEDLAQRVALKEAVNNLTVSEQQIFELFIKGASAKAIAERLGLSSYKKVYKELEKIERKLLKAIDEAQD